MPAKGTFEATPLRQLQRYHHTTLNSFGDGETLVEAIHRRPGFYGPNPIAYLSLMARRPTLTLGDLEEALVNDRSLVRATAFRGSLFLLASEDYPLYFRALYDTLSTTGMSRLRSEGIDEAQLQRFADKLRGDGASSSSGVSRQENEIIAALYPGKDRRPGVDVERTLLRKLCDIGVLVRTTSKGWKGNQFNYALAEQWLEGSSLVAEQVEQARVEVVRRYLRAYGPAKPEDVAWWTGLQLPDVRRVLDVLGREVVKFPVDGLGEGLVTLREVADQTRKGAGQPE
ncbi:MAG TPA: crosslink repair DNA glycosylase YcaQ family protein, partial [Myxococcota bacterium]